MAEGSVIGRSLLGPVSGSATKAGMVGDGRKEDGAAALGPFHMQLGPFRRGGREWVLVRVSLTLGSEFGLSPVSSLPDGRTLLTIKPPWEECAHGIYPPIL